MTWFILPILFLVFFFYMKNKTKREREKLRQQEFPPGWRKILIEEVLFYQRLTKPERKHFEERIWLFLLDCKITGVSTQVSALDKVLIAASAVIPVFRFPHFQYTTIDEVLVYPEAFDADWNTNKQKKILGMVGSGVMEGKMILSQQAIREGFHVETDRSNTPIHEFVHLIDKEDGIIDGIPEILLQKQYALPWLELIQRKLEEMMEGQSDINPYGATNKQEFLAVASEYFFEKPKRLKRNHPELYEMLQQIFAQNLAEINQTPIGKIGRNDPCVCGSGEKYKKCCGRY